MSLFHIIRRSKRFSVKRRNNVSSEAGSSMRNICRWQRIVRSPIFPWMRDSQARVLFSHVFARRIVMSPTAYRHRMRAIIRFPGEPPAELIPGCFSLMCGPSPQIRLWRGEIYRSTISSRRPIRVRISYRCARDRSPWRLSTTSPGQSSN
jgi:hypothetical protein